MLTETLLAILFRRRWRGFEPLFRWSGLRTVTARNRYGVRFALDPHDYVDSMVLREGFYETEVFEACRRAFSDDAVFWDIGSCFGLHAVTAKALHPRLAVHAFEPNPPGCAKIRANAALNRAAIELWPLALDERDGEATLYASVPGNSGMVTLRPGSDSLRPAAGQVRIARADTLIASHKVPAPTVIKLDVEGSELAVLRGFGDQLASPALRLIVLECAPAVLNPDGNHPIRELLRAAGFQLTSLSRLERTEHTLINVAAARPL